MATTTKQRALELLDLGYAITYSVTHDKFIIRDPKLPRVQVIRKATAEALILDLKEVEYNKFQRTL